MQRDSYFDNAKFILIFLVVFGHIIRSFIHDSEVILNVYKFIYSFHMPAFILISGYFAKGILDKGYISKLAKKLIMPYLIFQGIYSFVYFLFQDQSVDTLDPFDPHWSLWFLISMFLWNIVLIPYSKLKGRWAILLSIAIGIGAGYFDNISHYLSLSRTLVFLPLFLIGYFSNRKIFDKLTSNKGKVFSLVVLIGMFILCFYVEFDYHWLYGSQPYSEFGYVTVKDSFYRLLFYIVTIVTSMSFLSIIPKQRFFFTKWGTRTLYVYLLHGFLIQYVRNSHVLVLMKQEQNLFLFFLIAILLTMVLSTDIVKKITQPFIELRATSYK